MTNLYFFKVPKGVFFVRHWPNDTDDMISGYTDRDCYHNCNDIFAITEQLVTIKSAMGICHFDFDDNFRPEHVWNPERCIPDTSFNDVCEHKNKDSASEAIHSSASALYKVGAIVMDEFYDSSNVRK